ncbi:MAG: V-type ATPase subunit [Candidatus Kerfeldbacteria bacterium]
MSLYSFLTGKIRVLEKDLLNQMDVDRMVDAPDFDAAFKALNDTDYGSHLLNVDPTQFKQALDSETRSVRDLMLQWIEEPALLEFMFIKFDAHNIKLYLKAKTTGQDAAITDEYASPSGLTDPSLIKKIILDDDSETVIHPTTDQMWKEVRDRLGSEPTGFQIDSVVDLVMFEIMNERVNKVPGPIVRHLYQIQRETALVKTFVRGKLLGTPAAELKLVLPDEYLKHYDLDLEQAAEILPIEVKVKKALVNYIENKRLWEFEKELEEAELAVIREAKYATSGPMPAVGYFYAKQSAVRNLRMILTAKMNGIPAEEIKPRVRQLY